MSDFLDYHYNESDIQALQLTEENQPKIIKYLGELAASAKILNLSLTLSRLDEVLYNFTFRVASSTTPLSLAPHQYLLIKPSGMSVMDADVFEGAYTFRPEGVILDHGAILRI